VDHPANAQEDGAIADRHRADLACLRPAAHRVESFILSSDPLFVENVRDIVGLCLNPPEQAVVLCVDERSQGRALDRTQPTLPLAPGVPAHQTHDYRRHGVSSLFAALDVASGVVISDCHRRYRRQEFLRFLRLIEDGVPAELGIHLVLDSYGTHKVSKVKGWLARQPRFQVHFTPTGASWLNLVERLFAQLSDRRVQRAVTGPPGSSIRPWLTTWTDGTNTASPLYGWPVPT